MASEDSLAFSAATAATNITNKEDSAETQLDKLPEGTAAKSTAKKRDSADAQLEQLMRETVGDLMDTSSAADASSRPALLESGPSVGAPTALKPRHVPHWYPTKLESLGGARDLYGRSLQYGLRACPKGK